MSEPRNDPAAAQERVCPKCGEAVSLLQPADEDWLDVADYSDEDAEVWACTECEWNEEADPEEAFEWHMAELDWLSAKLHAIQEAESNG